MVLQVPHQRIVVKFSGELLRDTPEETFSAGAIRRLTTALRGLQDGGIEYGVVIGAGNLFRGVESETIGFDQIVGDQIGMLGTVMNALAVREALSREGIVAHVMAPQPSIPSVLPVDPLLARTLIAKKEPVLFAGGTGNPFFTTDSAATLRALEIGASLLVKATKVRGVYSKDPVTNPEAKRYRMLSFEDALQERLNVMDHTAVALAMRYGLSIFVYKFGDPLSILEALRSEDAGTYIVAEGLLQKPLKKTERSSDGRKTIHRTYEE
jgi:uridylate kinase